MSKKSLKSLGPRRRARRMALQFLYQVDLTGEALEPALENFRAAFGLDPRTREFFLTRVRGVVAGKSDLDRIIQASSRNWKLERMAKVDRNILRLAVFELTSCPDVPARVAINEAVELAKDFGTDDSGPFVNGVLDAIKASGLETRPLNGPEEGRGPAGEED